MFYTDLERAAMAAAILAFLEGTQGIERRTVKGANKLVSLAERFRIGEETETDMVAIKLVPSLPYTHPFCGDQFEAPDAKFVPFCTACYKLNGFPHVVGAEDLILALLQ